MSFLDELKGFKKDELAPTITVVTQPTGEKVKEICGNEVVDPTCERTDGVYHNRLLHQVVDGLFIGSKDAAAYLEGLKKHSVTHILNAAINCFNVYPDEFVYKSEPIYDQPSFDITPYLHSSADFIKDALDGGGKVLCHCAAGISRSSTLILAYLIKWRKMSLDEGLATVRVVRPFAQPNDGFMEQLKHYEAQCLLEC